MLSVLSMFGSHEMVLLVPKACHDFSRIIWAKNKKKTKKPVNKKIQKIKAKMWAIILEINQTKDLLSNRYFM